MESTFNNGLGMIAVVDVAVAAEAASAVGGHVVGTVVEGEGDGAMSTRLQCRCRARVPIWRR